MMRGTEWVVPYSAAVDLYGPTRSGWHAAQRRRANVSGASNRNLVVFGSFRASEWWGRLHGSHGRESRLCFADMVLLEDLRDKCSLWLQDQLTVDNVAVLWERASHANARGLEAACEAFMVCASLSQACRASVSLTFKLHEHTLSVSLCDACYLAPSAASLRQTDIREMEFVGESCILM
jgi:hypothetical protein